MDKNLTEQDILNLECEKCKKEVMEYVKEIAKILGTKEVRISEKEVILIHNKHTFETYTWEELRKFEEEGVGGEVCSCEVILMNSMTLECLICGKVQRQYAKNWCKRNKDE